jgi:hypothetical protein
MKWQKNTGVMPCEDNTYVEVKTADGTLIIGRAISFYWDTKPQQLITHYCIIDRVPFDYVEPKVWTTSYDARTGLHTLFHNGEVVYSLSHNQVTMHANEAIRDHLDAWEERNGTV